MRQSKAEEEFGRTIELFNQLQEVVLKLDEKRWAAGAKVVSVSTAMHGIEPSQYAKDYGPSQRSEGHSECFEYHQIKGNMITSGVASVWMI
jgi:hypothetical protein